MTALTADVVCRHSNCRCLLQFYQTTTWCNKQTHFLTLQLCFPLPGQLRCITIACNFCFSREKWSKASFSSMLFGLFSSPHNDYTCFYMRKMFIRKWASKTSKPQENGKKISCLKCLSCSFLKCWFFPGLFKS